MYQYHPAPQLIRTWAEADAWINGGRSRDSHRKLTKQRTLYRASSPLVTAPPWFVDGGSRSELAIWPEDIIFILYDTEIIAYHRDGTFTVNHGGMATKKTTIWDLGYHSPVRLMGVPGSSNGRRWWCEQWQIVHETDLRTEQKIQKCRKCHGRGEYIVSCGNEWWYGHRHDDAAWAALPGHVTVTYREPREWEIKQGTFLLNGVSTPLPADGRIPITRTRHRQYHPHRSCYHGFLERHIEFKFCGNCNGTGRRDYGSKQVHTPFNGPLRVDAEGRVMSGVELWTTMIAAISETRQRIAR